MVIASSLSFHKQHKNLNGNEYLHFTRNNIPQLQNELNIKLNPKYTFNDLSSLRSAIINGFGFGLIPYYVIKDDLENKLLYDYKIKFKAPFSFGLWWRFDNKNEEVKGVLSAFLKTVEHLLTSK